MGRKQLIWLSLAMLIVCMPVIARDYQQNTDPYIQGQNPNLPQNQDQNPNLPQNQDPNSNNGQIQSQSSSSTTLDQGVSKSGAYAIGWEEGYKRGFDHGKSDFTSGAKYDHDDYKDYKHTRAAYVSSMGSRKQFRKNYRRGFRVGYEDGYSGKPSQFASAAALPAPVPPAPIQSESEMKENERESSVDQSINPTPSTSQTLPATSDQSNIEGQSSTVPPSSSVDQNMGSNMGQTGTIQSRRLPRTASSLPLFGLIGMIAVPAALALRFLGSRA